MKSKVHLAGGHVCGKSVCRIFECSSIVTRSCDFLIGQKVVARDGM